MDNFNMVNGNVDSTFLTPASDQFSKPLENVDDRKSSTSQHNADSGYYSSGNIESTTVAGMKIQNDKQNLGREANCAVCTVNAHSNSASLYTNHSNFPTNVTSSISERNLSSVSQKQSDNFNKNDNLYISRNGEVACDYPKISSAISNPLVVSNHTHSDTILYRRSPSTADTNGIMETKSLNEKLQTEDATDLAMKIEFCLKFGYTISQIRSAISTLSCKATKNDILSELFNCSSVLNKQHIPIPNNIIPSQCRSFPDKGIDGNSSPQQVARGLDSPAQGEVRARGPSTFENESKEKSEMEDDSENLRPVVIDGSNVAMSHGNKQYFSCKGILIAVDYFRQRNHRDITVFIPTYRKESPRPDAPIKDREILDILERERILVYTPSRCINGKRITCYDDRFILRLAEETEGVIVSNDNFRDLQSEKPQWKELIEKRLLMYSFVNDRFMPPDDPLGRNGPSIDNFLRKRPECEEQSKPQCPYGKKCTYGKKCKYFHPECSFSQKSVTERLKENNEKRFNKTSSDAEQLAAELMKRSPQKTAQPKDTRPQNQAIKQELRQHQPTLTEHQPSQPDQHISNHSINNQMNGSYGYSNHPQQPNYQTPPPCDEITDDMRQLSMGNNPIQLNQQLQQPPQHRYATCQQQTRIPPVYIYPDGGPPAFHKNSPQTVRSHGNMGQPQPRVHPHHYQHSSPSNFQLPDRAGNSPHQPFPNIQSYPHYNLPPNPVYHPMYPDIQYQQQAMQQLIYPYPMARHNSPMHTLVQPNPLYSSGSHRSESSLSHSYPFVQSEDGVHVNLVNPGHNHSSPNPDDPKTYPPSTSRRVYSSPNHPQPSPLVHPVVRPHTHAPQMEPQPRPAPNHPLNSPSNPRHNLYKNLCGLFARTTVEDIMLGNPNKSDPRILIKMCLEESS